MYTLHITNKNYSSWSLRPWVLMRACDIAFNEVLHPYTPGNAVDFRDISPTGKVPWLVDGDTIVWDSLAIIEYLAEHHAGIWPTDAQARAWARCAAAEMHSGFASLRAALPMNLKARFPNFTVWSRAKGDIERVVEIWHDCLQQYGGPFLFGKKPTLADAMYAPVATRFMTYDVALDEVCAAYCQTIMTLPVMKEWIEAAKGEPDDIEELEMEF